jgi:hypothetical protein
MHHQKIRLDSNQNQNPNRMQKQQQGLHHQLKQVNEVVVEQSTEV